MSSSKSFTALRDWRAAGWWLRKACRRWRTTKTSEHVRWWSTLPEPAPRTSLDCEQAARALLDDLTQPGYSGEYQTWIGSLPQGGSDVQPGEQWNISAPSFGLSCAVIVREVEIGFQNLSDQYALFTLKFANDAAQPFAIRFVAHQTQRAAYGGVQQSAG